MNIPTQHSTSPQNVGLMKWLVLAIFIILALMFGLGFYVGNDTENALQTVREYQHQLDESTARSEEATQRLNRVLDKIEGLERALERGGYSLRIVPSGTHMSRYPFDVPWELLGVVASAPENDAAIPYLFEWVQNSVSYEQVFIPRKEQTAIETLKRRTGVCIEQSYLYAVALRLAGVQADIAIVNQDHEGKKVNHACVMVTRQDGQTQLVDPAYHLIDAQHVSWYPATDIQMVRRFSDAYVHTLDQNKPLGKMLNYLISILR